VDPLRQTLILLSWIFGWLLFWKLRFLAKEKTPFSPRVSVIVPARNEEKNIGSLLRSLERQTYKNFEVIVVNDNSEDATEKVVSSFDVKLVNLRGDPPEGWVGKSWACWNGYLSSEGDVLIFLDADVELQEEALESLVSTLLREGGLVSVWPYQRFEKLYEHLTLPFNLVAIGAMGSFSVFKTKPTGAYGPAMATSRKDYEEVGTHEVSKDSVIEDVALGKKFLEKGYKVNNYLGGELIRFRMYPNGFKELFEGFTKNMALGAASAGLNSLFLFLWIVGLYSSLFNLLELPHWYLLFAAQLYVVSRRTGDYSLLDALLYPVHFLFFLCVFLFSIFRVLFLKNVAWKGRRIRV